MPRLASALSARVALLTLLAGVAAVTWMATAVRTLLRRRPCDAPENRRRVLLTGTFYSEGWLRAHLRPLAESETLSDVLVVCDQPSPELPKVRYLCPSVWARRLLGRSFSRILLVIRTAIRHRPAYVIGYHIMPNALAALVAARVIGARAIYQCCGGPSELLAGGVHTENRLLSRLITPSPAVERALLARAAACDAIITRGRSAASFFQGRGVRGLTAVIPGSIDVDHFAPQTTDKPSFDLVTVGRLVDVKRVDRFIDVVDRLRSGRPTVRGLIVGSGPLRGDLEEMTRRRGLANHVVFAGHQDDVAPFLAKARVFVLTSASEGLAIALAEAMATGLPAVVTDVGDLRELVEEGRNGFLIEGGEPARFAARIAELLHDEALWLRFSAEARTRAVSHCGSAAVTKRWHELLERLVSEESVSSTALSTVPSDEPCFEPSTTSSIDPPAVSSAAASTDPSTVSSAVSSVIESTDTQRAAAPYALPWVGESRFD